MYVHVRNRSEHKLTNGLTPFEIWNGYKPSVRHLRIFGSLAFVHVPKVKRNKLSKTSKLGILVGYATRTKGYRIYIPEERRVVETIHASFDKTKNGVETLFGKNKKCEYVRYKDSYQEQVLDNKEETVQKKEEMLPIKIEEWKRVEAPRKLSSRIDVYYYPPSSKERLRSTMDVERFCAKNGLKFQPELFSFKSTSPKHEDSGDSSTDCVVQDFEDIFEDEVYNLESPRTYEETQESADKDKLNKSMEDEIQTMKNRKVWDLVEPPENAQIIGSRWVYNVKRDDKNQMKFKSRLVAQGFKQIHF
ncbi:uncharacterized protein [Parasteatoda tepidariorum]|uniref:uncharacterized protein isoform X3 n=1 Tax=Parasteatoda tepidariorum TaxID=114398 RepID=UPI0039BD1CF2